MFEGDALTSGLNITTSINICMSRITAFKAMKLFMVSIAAINMTTLIAAL
jgi:hypothetical protein